jgi:hypothetical protein
MSEIRSFKPITSALDWIGRYQVVQSLLAVKWPAGLALLAAMSGYVGHAPLMWIVMATAMTFMAGIVAIFFSNQYSQNRTPAHKLRYNGTLTNCSVMPLNRKSKRAAQSVTGDTQSVVQRHIDKIQIGVSLFNSAPFPIFVHIEHAETEMESKTPPRTKYPKDSVEILPGNVVFMTDQPISMDGHPCERIEGKMDIIVKYGRKNDEKYELRFKGKVEALIRPDGFLQGNYTHWDSQQI